MEAFASLEQLIDLTPERFGAWVGPHLRAMQEGMAVCPLVRITVTATQ